MSLTEDFGYAEGERVSCKTDTCLFLQRFVAISMHLTSRMSLSPITCSLALQEHQALRQKAAPKSGRTERVKSHHLDAHPYQHTHMQKP